mmetsp:Transcript_34512/g.55125  ORF Transcript_34512/g.55125 Transcript_34512/m.55125 type:complete len:97 (-) Transcript_34512:1455-1745(-)
MLVRDLSVHMPSLKFMINLHAQIRPHAKCIRQFNRELSKTTFEHLDCAFTGTPYVARAQGVGSRIESPRASKHVCKVAVIIDASRYVFIEAQKIWS